MKKNLLIWGTAIVLVVIALYVTKVYGNGAKVLPSNSQSAASQGSVLQTGSSQPTGTISDETIGQKALDFTLTDLNGNKVSLKDYKGKSVYINFWTTWCTWCKEEMPNIDKVSKEYADKGLVVLAIDIGENRDTVEKFISENKYGFKVLLDSDQKVSQEYNITSIPVSIFIDKNGNVAAKRVGAMSGEDMKANIEKLLKQ